MVGGPDPRLIFADQDRTLLSMKVLRNDAHFFISDWGRLARMFDRAKRTAFDRAVVTPEIEEEELDETQNDDRRTRTRFPPWSRQTRSESPLRRSTMPSSWPRRSKAATT
jgi:hypothetical protein